MPPLSKQNQAQKEKRAGPASVRGRPKKKDDIPNDDAKGDIHNRKAITYEDLKSLDRDQLLSSLNQLLASVEQSDRNKGILESIKDVGSKNLVEGNKRQLDAKSNAGPASKKRLGEGISPNRKPGPASKTDATNNREANNSNNTKGNFAVYRDQYETRRKRRPQVPRNRSMNPANSQENDNEKFEPQYFRVFSDNPVYRTTIRMSDITSDMDTIDTSDESNNEQITMKKSGKESGRNIKSNKPGGRRKVNNGKKNDNEPVVDLTLTDTTDTEDLRVGDKVLAMWKLNQKYPAKIIDIEPNEAILVEFYDGVLWKVKPNKVWKMNRDEEDRYKGQMEDMENDNSSDEEITTVIDEVTSSKTKSLSKRKKSTSNDSLRALGPKQDMSSDENEDKDGLVWQRRPNHIINPKPGPASSKRLRLSTSQTINFPDNVEEELSTGTYKDKKSSGNMQKKLIGPKSRIHRSWNPDSDILAIYPRDNDTNETTSDNLYHSQVWQDWIFSMIWEYDQKILHPTPHVIKEHSIDLKDELGDTIGPSLASAYISPNGIECNNENLNLIIGATLTIETENDKNEDLKEWTENVFNDIWKRTKLDAIKGCSEELLSNSSSDNKEKISYQDSVKLSQIEDKKLVDTVSLSHNDYGKEPTLGKEQREMDELKTLLFDQIWENSKALVA